MTFWIPLFRNARILDVSTFTFLVLNMRANNSREMKGLILLYKHYYELADSRCKQ